MAINPDELVLSARDMVTDIPESVTLSADQIFSMIPAAVLTWQEQTADDPEKRQDWIVESDDITIDAGVADIGPEVDAKGFRLDWLKEGDIEMSNNFDLEFTVKFVSTLDRLKMVGRQDKFVWRVYRSGRQLRFCEPGQRWNAQFNGVFKIRGVVIPQDLSILPKTAAPAISLVLADMCRKTLREENRGLNRPPRR